MILYLTCYQILHQFTKQKFQDKEKKVLFFSHEHNQALELLATPEFVTAESIK